MNSWTELGLGSFTPAQIAAADSLLSRFAVPTRISEVQLDGGGGVASPHSSLLPPPPALFPSSSSSSSSFSSASSSSSSYPAEPTHVGAAGRDEKVMELLKQWANETTNAFKRGRVAEYINRSREAPWVTAYPLLDDEWIVFAFQNGGETQLRAVEVPGQPYLSFYWAVSEKCEKQCCHNKVRALFSPGHKNDRPAVVEWSTLNAAMKLWPYRKQRALCCKKVVDSSFKCPDHKSDRSAKPPSGVVPKPPSDSGVPEPVDTRLAPPLSKSFTRSRSGSQSSESSSGEASASSSGEASASGKRQLPGGGMGTSKLARVTSVESNSGTSSIASSASRFNDKMDLREALNSILPMALDRCFEQRRPSDGLERPSVSYSAHPSYKRIVSDALAKPLGPADWDMFQFADTLPSGDATMQCKNCGVIEADANQVESLEKVCRPYPDHHLLTFRNARKRQWAVHVWEIAGLKANTRWHFKNPDGSVEARQMRTGLKLELDMDSRALPKGGYAKGGDRMDVLTEFVAENYVPWVAEALPGGRTDLIPQWVRYTGKCQDIGTSNASQCCAFHCQFMMFGNTGAAVGWHLDAMSFQNIVGPIENLVTQPAARLFLGDQLRLCNVRGAHKRFPPSDFESWANMEVALRKYGANCRQVHAANVSAGATPDWFAYPNLPDDSPEVNHLVMAEVDAFAIVTAGETKAVVSIPLDPKLRRYMTRARTRSRRTPLNM
jgi:hypothetical protein